MLTEKFEWVELNGKRYRRFIDSKELERRRAKEDRRTKRNSITPTPSGCKPGDGETSKIRNALSPLTQGMARWVSRYSWTHWCTFTFRQETSEYGARRQFERLFNRFSHSGWKCSYFVVERGSRYDRVHLHAIGVFKGDSANIVWEFAKNKLGRAQVRPFEHEGGAVEYITNYIEKETIDWDILGIPEERI